MFGSHYTQMHGKGVQSAVHFRDDILVGYNAASGSVPASALFIAGDEGTGISGWCA